MVLCCPLQISERRKLVSSINSDSIAKSEGSSVSYERSSDGRSHAFENQNGAIVGLNGDFDEAGEDVRIAPPETTSFKPDTLPAFLANGPETSSLEVENQEGVSESSLKEAIDESSDIEGEGEIPPPLAGANVMNVIVVAAECAPWSKTGDYNLIISMKDSPYWMHFDVAELSYDKP